ncbi:MAG: hypothetical protein IIB57_11285, partial [Planctomycetes bacterium]|nr:hypothetical protein [Planctomycetota bacterium]
MIKLIRRLAAPWLILASVPIALAQPSDALPGVRAHLRLESRYIVLGSPIWAFFSIENASDEAITLTVPRTELDLPDAEIGLPMCHVFSGTGGTGVAVVKENGRKWESPVGYRAPKEAPPLLIAPRSTVGSRLDLRALFPALKASGKYTVTWRPYGGEVTSETVSFDVAPLKQAEILTDFGEVLQTESNAVLTLGEAATRSGYSEGHLGRLVRQRKIPNAGEPRSPRIRVVDLPMRPSAVVAERRPRKYDP